MPSDPNRAAEAPIALATQCFAPDFGGIEIMMTGLADAVAASGRAIEVFADHIRRRDAGELARPYPIRRFGSIRPLRRWMKRRALAERARFGFAGVLADSWKSVAAIPDGVGPIAVTVYGNEIPVDPDGPRARRVRAALSRARTVIAISQFTAEMTRRVVASAATNIVIVNPPLEPQEIAGPAAGSTGRIGMPRIISTGARSGLVGSAPGLVGKLTCR